MKKCYYIFLNFEAINSNINYSGLLNNVRFKINGKYLSTIVYYRTCNPKAFEDFNDHDQMEEKIIYNFSSIGLIMDIITVVTEIIISSDYDGMIFDHDEKILNNFYNEARSFDDIYNEIKQLRRLTNIGMQSNFFPPTNNKTVTFSEEKIKNINYLLDNFFKKNKFNNTQISLFNYWKKGLILLDLHYMEESFLSFYKILEFFLSKYKSSEAVDNLIEEFDIKDKCISKRLISSFVKIRNNYDIAHMKIKRGFPNRDEFFNLSFYDNFWEKYYDIKEVVKFLIFKYVNIGKIDFYIGKLNSLDIKIIE